MTVDPIRVLLIDGQIQRRQALNTLLAEQYGFEVFSAADTLDVLTIRSISRNHCQVAILGQEFTDPAALSGALQSIRANQPDIEIIVLDPVASPMTLTALRVGVHPISTRHLSPDELAATIEAAAARSRVSRERRTLTALHQLAGDLNAIRKPQEVLQLTCQAAVDIFGVDHSGLVEFASDNTYGRLMAEYPPQFSLGRGQASTARILVQGVTAEERLVLAQRELNIPDVANAHSLGPVRDVLINLGIRSTLILPVVVQGRTVASFSLDAIDSPRRFTDSDVALSRNLAVQAALALETARYLEDAEQRTAELTTLRETALAITSEWDRQALLTTIIQKASGLLHSRGGGLYEYDRVAGCLRVVADCGNNRQINGCVLRVGEGMAGRLVQSGEPFLIVPDYEHWVGQASIYSDQRLFEAVIAVPLRWQDSIRGVLYLEDKLGRKFTESDAHLLSWFADQAAVALHNADLMRDLNQQKDRLQLLLDASTLVAQDESPPATLQHLADLIQRAFDRPFCWLGIVATGLSVTVATLHGFSPLRPGGREFGLVDLGLLQPLLASETPIVVRREEGSAQAALAWADLLGQDLPPLEAALLVPLNGRTGLVGFFAVGETRCGPDDHFDSADLELARTLMGHLATLLDDLRLFAARAHRQQLLTALAAASRHMRAEHERPKLTHDIVRLTAEAVGFPAAALFGYRSHIDELEVIACFRLPATLLGRIINQSQGPIGRVARAGSTLILHGRNSTPLAVPELDPCQPRTLVAAPLGQTGEVEAVLVLVDDANLKLWTSDDQEILGQLVTQASIALETASLIGDEQRWMPRLALHNRMNDYIQAVGDIDKIAHVLLTTITAGYGLGFNRAGLFLLDEKREVLVGRLGIGHHDEALAIADWREHDGRALEDFRRYLDALEGNALPLTPIGESMRGLSVTIRPADPGVFSRAVFDRRHHIVAGELDLASLPEPFRLRFRPFLPCAIIPVVARSEVFGVLVVDNKFTEQPITSNDIEAICLFSTAAAIAIENVRLLQANRTAHDNLALLYRASNTLTASHKPDEILQMVVEQVMQAAGAQGASLVLIDETARQRHLAAAGIDLRAAPDIRQNGLSMQVLKTSRPVFIEDTSDETMRHRVNPSLFERGITAAAGLPFAVSGRCLGVVWIHYEQARRFGRLETENWQLYVNQAALAYSSARRIKELEYMRQAAATLAGAAGWQAVLKQVVLRACDVLGANSAVIWLYDPRHGQFSPESSVAAGISDEMWVEYQRFGPRPGGTTDQVMTRGWVGVSDIDDLTEGSHAIGEFTRHLLKKIGVRSYEGVSLGVDGERLGVLYVNFGKPRGFSTDEQADARAFADHAALALKQARLLERLNDAQKAIGAVAEVMTVGNREASLNAIAQRLQETVGCQAVTLYVYDAATQKLYYPPYCVGLRYPERVQVLDHVKPGSIVLRMMARDEPRIVRDATVDLEFRDLRFTKDEGIKACVAVPLQAGGQKVGVTFVNYRTQPTFSADDLANILLFCNQAALAIRNAQLYENAQKRTRLLEAASQVAHSAAGVLDEGHLLLDVVERVRECFAEYGVYHAAVFLIEGEYAVLHAASSDGSQCRLVKGHRLRVGKEGMVGHVAQHGGYRLAPDVRQEVFHFRNPNLPETRAEMSFALTGGNNIFGVLDVQSREVWHLQDEEISALRTMADQLASAIHVAQLYHEVSEYFHAADELQRIATQLANAAEREEPREAILNLVVGEAQRLIGFEEGGVIFWEADGQTLVEAHFTGSDGRLVSELQGAQEWANQARRIVADQVYWYVADLAQGERSGPPLLDQGFRTLLCVPLSDGSSSIAILFLLGRRPSTLSSHQIALVQALAGQAVGAIARARHYDDLRRIVGARTALAWLGMISATWLHSIEKHALTIREQVELLRRQLAGGRAGPADVEERLERIERLASQIIAKPITPPLSAAEGVVAVDINALIRERIRRLHDDEAYRGIKLLMELQVEDEGASVRASPEWLRRALDILLHNAVAATEGREQRLVTISTRLKSEWIEVEVKDNGWGIPDDVRPYILHDPIPKTEGAEGLGIGLLLAQIIVQTYGGVLQVGATSQSGTAMVIRLEQERTLTTRPPTRFLVIGHSEYSQFQEFLAQALTPVGPVQSAVADAAADCVRQSRPDLIVIDESEVENALALVTELIALDPRTRIVVATMVATWERARDVLRAGAVDYVTKSFSQNDWLRLVRSLLDPAENQTDPDKRRSPP